LALNNTYLADIKIIFVFIFFPAESDLGFDSCHSAQLTRSNCRFGMLRFHITECSAFAMFWRYPGFFS
jgi:hypothetical protein